MYSAYRPLLRFAGICLACWVFLRWLLPIGLPFLLGAAMALAAEPAVRFFTGRLRFPRTAASAIGVSAVFAGVCALSILLLTFLFRELGALAGILPDMEGMVREGLEALQEWLLTLSSRTPQSFRPLLRRNVTSLFSGGTALLDRATRYALSLAGTLLTHVPDSALALGTALLSAFLISSRLPGLQKAIQNRIGPQRLAAAADLLRRFRQTAGLWLLAEMKLCCITYLIIAAGLLLLRIAYAPLWALAVAAVDAFPILGTGTVLIPWSLVCLLRRDTPRALGLLGLYAAAAAIRSVLEPRFVGRQLGLDPLVTLVALYAGFRLWGMAGMLLMPLLALTALKTVNKEL